MAGDYERRLRLVDKIMELPFPGRLVMELYLDAVIGDNQALKADIDRCVRAYPGDPEKVLQLLIENQETPCAQENNESI